MKWLLLATLGCGGGAQSAVVSTCITECGVRASSVNATCVELQLAEDLVLAAYEEEVGFNKAKACVALDGVQLSIHIPSSQGYWYDKDKGYDVEGMYHGGFRKVIELADVPLFESAYAHEMGHALEHELLGAVGHRDWAKRGFERAITKWEAYFR